MRLTADTLRLLFRDSPRPEWPQTGATLVPAAVLMPVVEHEGGLTLLLTQRTGHLREHAGQISFPGGRRDPGDDDPVVAALRESAEEIGLPAQRVTVLGSLPPYNTTTGFEVVPVLGLVKPPLVLTLDAFEVASVFEVPLDFMINPANHQQHEVVWQGRRRHYYAIPYQDWFVWGATAGMIVVLAERLRDHFSVMSRR